MSKNGRQISIGIFTRPLKTLRKWPLGESSIFYEQTGGDIEAEMENRTVHKLAAACTVKVRALGTKLSTSKSERHRPEQCGFGTKNAGRSKNEVKLATLGQSLGQKNTRNHTELHT